MTDIDRIIEGLSEAQRKALNYHAQEDRNASSGSMGIDMTLLFSGFVDFSGDGRLSLTSTGQAVRARLMEMQAET